MWRIESFEVKVYCTNTHFSFIHSCSTHYTHWIYVCGIPVRQVSSAPYRFIFISIVRLPLIVFVLYNQNHDCTISHKGCCDFLFFSHPLLFWFALCVKFRTLSVQMNVQTCSDFHMQKKAKQKHIRIMLNILKQICLPHEKWQHTTDKIIREAFYFNAHEQRDLLHEF